MAGNTVEATLNFSSFKVGAKPVSCWLMLAYDDLYSIQYMKQNLRPYWRRNGWEAADLMKAAAHDYPSLEKRCAAFDDEMMAELTRAGGENYAKIAALAYRQCFAAGKFVADANGQPLQFCKENHSNGCISTVGRVLSDVAAVFVVQPHAGQVVHCAVHELCGERRAGNFPLRRTTSALIRRPTARFMAAASAT